MKYRLEDHVYVKDTPRYGESLFARKDFKKGELVFVAFGSIITGRTRYMIPINEEEKIDPTISEGNLCKYLCHSCDPNLGVKQRTLFVAFRDIKKGKEVTVDYGMLGYAYQGELTEEERKCFCGSPICRGKLGCYKELSSEIRQKYAGYISDYLLDPKYQ